MQTLELERDYVGTYPEHGDGKPIPRRFRLIAGWTGPREPMLSVYDYTRDAPRTYALSKLSGVKAVDVHGGDSLARHRNLDASPVDFSSQFLNAPLQTTVGGTRRALDGAEDFGGRGARSLRTQGEAGDGMETTKELACEAADDSKDLPDLTVLVRQHGELVRVAHIPDPRIAYMRGIRKNYGDLGYSCEPG